MVVGHLQVQTDPGALAKLAALFQKLRSVMRPAMTDLAAHPDDDAQHEIAEHFTGVLLQKVQAALKVSPRDSLNALHWTARYLK